MNKTEIPPLNGFAAEVHQNAIDHGWWDNPPDDETIFALMHSELSEALEEHRDKKPILYYTCPHHDTRGGCPDKNDACQYGANDGCTKRKPCGVGIELADCALRILDYCGRHKIDIDSLIGTGWRGGELPLPTLIMKWHWLLSTAWGDTAKRGHCLAEYIHHAAFWFDCQGEDLNNLMRLKHDYNKTRPHKHGGKRY